MKGTFSTFLNNVKYVNWWNTFLNKQESFDLREKFVTNSMQKFEFIRKFWTHGKILNSRKQNRNPPVQTEFFQFSITLHKSIFYWRNKLLMQRVHLRRSRRNMWKDNSCVKSVNCHFLELQQKWIVTNVSVKTRTK